MNSPFEKNERDNISIQYIHSLVFLANVMLKSLSFNLGGAQREMIFKQVLDYCFIDYYEKTCLLRGHVVVKDELIDYALDICGSPFFRQMATVFWAKIVNMESDKLRHEDFAFMQEMSNDQDADLRKLFVELTETYRKTGKANE
jgi:hypothetical protein